MNKTTAEEANNSFAFVRNFLDKKSQEGDINSFELLEVNPEMRILDEFISKHQPPTLDEVIRAWEEILDESDVKTGKKIRVKISKGSALIEVFAIWCSDIWATICEINENEIDFKLNINMNNLKAINLTIKYLESQKEKENDSQKENIK